MYSFLTTLTLIAALVWRRPPILVQLPVIVLIIYNLLGSAVLWLISFFENEYSELLWSVISQDAAGRTDLIMSTGSAVFSLGLLSGYNKDIRKRYRTPQSQSNDDLVVWRSLALAVPLCLFIFQAWVNNFSAGSSEEVRLALLQSGYWPFITALFGWILPVLVVACASRMNGLIKFNVRLRSALITTIATSIILSILLGFRTYAALAFLVGIAFYSINRRVTRSALFIYSLLAIGAFTLVTVIRVQNGNIETISEILSPLLRRLSFEPIGAAELIFSITDREGFYIGRTLLMDLNSKLPGRQETFAGQLGQEAGFDEGLTLTASGILEIYANFGYLGLPILLLIAYLAGQSLTDRNANIASSLARRLFTFLFLIDFIMGGSSAVFDLIVRIFLFRFALKIKIFS